MTMDLPSVICPRCGGKAVYIAFDGFGLTPQTADVRCRITCSVCEYTPTMFCANAFLALQAWNRDVKTYPQGYAKWWSHTATTLT